MPLAIVGGASACSRGAFRGEGNVGIRRGAGEGGDRKLAALIELFFPWVVLVGGALFAVFFVIGRAISMMSNPKCSAIALGNVPSAIGLPCAAPTSLCLMVFRKENRGPR